MEQNRFEIEIISQIDKLPLISDFVTDTLLRFEADSSTIYHVQLVIDEACTNVIKYAYPAEEAGYIKLVIELAGDELIITLTDQGKPFDLDSIPPPDLSSDVAERKVGGLGIYFIKKLMDAVSYSFDAKTGNRLTLKKRLHSG